MTLKYLFPLCAALCLSPVAYAQSSGTADTPKPAPSETQPASPEKTHPANKPAQKTAPKDLDSFFKEGERQAKEGPTCEKKPEPVA